MLKPWGALAALVLMTACAEATAPARPHTPGLALAGTTWIVAGADTGPRGEPPSIEFGSESRAGGFAGCNAWFANFDATDGLRFASVGATRRACPEPAMSTERQFLAALGATVNAQRDEDTLRLVGSEDETLLTLQRQP